MGESRIEKIIRSITAGAPYTEPTGSDIEDALLELKEAIEGSGGTGDYPDLTNKPSINGNELNGNQSGSDLGLVDDHGTYFEINGIRVYVSATEPTGTIPDGSIWLGSGNVNPITVV